MVEKKRAKNARAKKQKKECKEKVVTIDHSGYFFVIMKAYDNDKEEI